MSLPGSPNSVLHSPDSGESGGAASHPGAPPTAYSVAAAFARVASRTPGAVAVSTAGDRLSYRELDDWAEGVARRLLELGLAPGDRVALLLDRSFELVVGQLAALKAGAAYVPIDPSLPPARVALLLDQTAPKILIADSVPAGTSTTRAFDVAAEVLPLRGRDPGDRAAVAATPESLAYIMFTSGSTGTPKGVAIPHRGILRLVIDPDYVRLSSDEVILGFAPASFDASTFEVWGALLNGGRLHLAPPGAVDLDALGETIERGGVTTAWLTAALFNQVVETQLGRLAGLRQLLAGGDVVSVAHARQLLERWPECRLINGYGPTENTTFTCCHTIRPSDLERPSLPIGRPIRGTSVYITDPDLRPVPDGEWGELCAGGEGLALGYWRRDDLTAERFVALSRPEGGETVRVYRTGDRVRKGADGTIEFGGRLDRQVKIRGYRIEPGEIEASVRQEPGVREVVVDVRPGPQGDGRLVAYVQVEAAGGRNLSELAKTAASRLPAYMVPAAWVEVESWPVTPNGKIDRAALRAPEWRSPAVVSAHPGLEPSAQALAEIWKLVLGVPSVAVEDDFFAMGGDSLLAMRMMAQVRARLGKRLRFEQLSGRSTFGEVAAALEAASPEKFGKIPPLAAGSGPLPLSFAQSRMWFAHELAAGGPLYNVVMSVEVRGSLQLPALRTALEALAARHESLRTRYFETAGEPRQEVLDAPPVSLEIKRVASAAELPARIAAEARRPISLTQGSPWRVTALECGPGFVVLVFAVHHIAVDGWSMSHLWHDLGLLYRESLGLGAAALPPQLLRYRDFAVWRRDLALAGEFDAQLPFWRRTLYGVPPLEIATDHPRKPGFSWDGDRLPVSIPAELAERVRAASRAWGVTPFVVLLSGFILLLQRRGASPDLAVGTMVAGRNRPELEPIVGVFINTLALRVRTGGLQSAQDLVEEVRRVAADAFDHQDVPFDAVVGALAPERHPGRHPICQVMFVLQNTPRERLELQGAAVSQPVEVGTGTAKFDLLLSLDPESEGHFGGYFEYRTDLFDRSTAEAMLGELGRTLEDLVRHPTGSLEALRSGADARVASAPLPPEEPEGEPRFETQDQHGMVWLTERLCRVWEEALQLPGEVTPDDDFFALGGHSLLASRLVHVIHQQLKTRIRIGDIMLHSTPRAMARHLSLPRGSGPAALLVELQGEGSLPPFAYVYGDYWADGLYCRGIAAALAPEQPFFAMGYPRVDAHGRPGSVQSFAAHYVKVLLQRFGAGPLRIGGFCNGAIIAFEVARQLRQHGVQLDRVVLVDPSAENLRFRGLRFLLEGVRRVLPEGPAVAVNSRFLSILELAHPTTPAERRAVFRRLRSRLFGDDAELPPADQDPDLARPEGMLIEAAREKFVRHVRRAVGAYIPGPLDCSVDLVLSSSLDLEETRRLWNRVTTGSRAIQLSFPHIEMLRRDLPDVLRSLLIGPGHDRD